VEGAGEADSLRGVDMDWICCRVLERRGRDKGSNSATSDARDACDEGIVD
jgi:hypothetical protein